LRALVTISSLFAFVCGCRGDRAPYPCTTSAQCPGGTCEAIGFCSAPDDACPSRKRFAELAGAGLGGQCVPCAAQIASGRQHSCARKHDGTVWCWGAGAQGNLGTGVTNSTPTPGMVRRADTGAPLTDVVHLALGSRHGCATDAGGAVWCWGDNDHDQVGVPGAPIVQLLAAQVQRDGAPLADGARVAAGQTHSCALLRDGSVWCWGENNQGQLGADPIGVPASVAPIQIAIEGGVDVSSGPESHHTCALLADGALVCWGANGDGELGDGTMIDRLAPVRPLERVAAVAVGGRFTCASMLSGAVSCFGANESGQLGIAPGPARASPAELPGLAGARLIATGVRHACVIDGDGALACWGAGEAGQLGRDAVADPAPARVLEAVVSADGGDVHTCAAAADGLVYCFGSNADGQLGDNTMLDHTQPAPSLLACP